MATLTYNVAKAVSLVAYEKPFQFGVQGAQWGYEPLVGEEKSTTKTKQVFPVAGLPIPTLTKEGQSFYFADMAELDAVTITMYKYSLSTSISWEAEQYAEKTLGKLMTARAKEMAANYKYLKGLVIGTDWSNIATNTGFDGVAIAGTHTTRAGNSVDTDLTAASLDYDSGWDMWDFFRTSMYNEAGIKVQANAFACCGHPSLQRRYQKVFKSEQEPDTLGNFNGLKGKIRFIENPHAASATRYTFVSDGIKNDYRVYTVLAPKTDTDQDKTHDMMHLLSKTAFGTGWVAHYHIVSNAGA